MRKIYLYAHGGSGNHGCEAIVRSTLKLFKDIDAEKILISTRPDEDKRYGLDELCKIVKEKQRYPRLSLQFIRAYLYLKLKNDYAELDKLEYKKAINSVSKGDLALSIGGDNYCYADVERYIMLHDMLLSRGAKTVLWGCSIEPELLDNIKISSDIKRYSLITSRESISYEALKKVNPNTVLVSDPAFSLDAQFVNLPKDLVKNKFVGINLSPMIVENEIKSGITLTNYNNLIEYIINKTEFNIALIPHVVWDFTDDREILKILYDKYKYTNRVFMIEDCSCEKLKYVISKCEYFIGARTHSTIAAYSTGVPTLVVGYSVKAKGIAKDLFGSYKGYVLPVQSLSTPQDLKYNFIWLMQNENNVRNIYDSILPEYLSKCYDGINKLNDIINNVK